MENLHSKKSLKEFTDRQLLLFIMANQVNIFREIERVQKMLNGDKDLGIGLYSESFKELISDTRDILNQAEQYMQQDNIEKGFLEF